MDNRPRENCELIVALKMDICFLKVYVLVVWYCERGMQIQEWQLGHMSCCTLLQEDCLIFLLPDKGPGPLQNVHVPGLATLSQFQVVCIGHIYQTMQHVVKQS